MEILLGGSARSAGRWLVVLNEQESLDAKPDWADENRWRRPGSPGKHRAGTGPMHWADPAPYYIQRSLPLLGKLSIAAGLAMF